MHGLALAMAAVAGCTESKRWGFGTTQALLSAAQRVVTYFRASHMPLAALRAAADMFKISTGLKTSNTTRLSSVYICVDSVVKLELAFRYLLTNEPQVLDKAPAVRSILERPNIWENWKLLCRLLEPIAKVIEAVQRDHATLADVTRYWLYVARELAAVLPSLPSGAPTWG